MDKVQAKLVQINKLSSNLLDRIDDNGVSKPGKSSPDWVSGGVVVLQQTFDLLKQFGTLLDKMPSTKPLDRTPPAHSKVYFSCLPCKKGSQCIVKCMLEYILSDNWN